MASEQDVTALKDITSSAFGLVLAYLLPGLFAEYSASFWFPPLSNAFGAFLKADSTGALFFLILLAALLIGVELTAFRWVLFERVVCRKIRLENEYFEKLSSQYMIAAFRVAVDEHFRYHQFWGALVFVVPFFTYGAARAQSVSLFTRESGLVILIGVVVEVVTYFAAINAYERYVTRARAILKKG